MTYKHILQRAAVSAATIAVVAGGGLAVAPSASAAESDCPTGMVCVFQDANYSGRWIGDTNDRANVGDYMNDRTSSIVNTTGSNKCFYQDVDYGGPLLTVVYPHTAFYYVNDYANDRISSWRTCPM